MKKHAELSASKSEIWLRCPGSIELSKEAPEPEESRYATEGILAHELLEFWLKHLIKTPFKPLSIPKRFPNSAINAVGSCVSEVTKIWKHGKTGALASETKVSLGFIEEGMFGTADIRVIEHFGTLWVLDYKHGAGIAVDVTDPNNKGRFNHNTQLIYYALGSAHEFNYDFEKVVIGISQPRALHHEGPFRTATLSINHLKSYSDLFRKGVERVRSPKPKFFAGSWCRWCPAKPICPTFKKVANSDAARAFAEVAQD